jgi:dihydropyrimidine dehydrogenase (NAD+) subunit PreA
MPKLTFHTLAIAQSAKACKEAGARAVSAINTIRGIIGIDIERGRILSDGANGKTYLGGISGPLIKPFGLRAVAEIQMEVAGIEVCAVGGIDGWESAIEYIMVGASLVQVCTAAMWYGFPLGKKLNNGLAKFMRRKNYNSLADFKGIALKHIDYSQNKESIRAYPIINAEKCNFCKRCLRACNDAAYCAIFVEDSTLKVNRERCECCGLCRVVCKEEAISYKVGI